MAHVNITKDLTEVKSKVVFGLTKRQLIFFVLAALVAVPIYFLTRESLGNDIALVLLITTALPFFFFALYEKNGQPPEKILKNYIRVRFLTQQARPYRTDNRFAALERQERFNKEVEKLVSIPNKTTGKDSRGLGTSRHPARHKAVARRPQAGGKSHKTGKKGR